MKLPSASTIERWPRLVRAILGCSASGLATLITYSIHPLSAFPFLLGFPTVVLSAWFLGMSGGITCGITEAILVDTFLTKDEIRFSLGSAPQQLRLTIFVTVSIFLGWAVRRLAAQRAALSTQELQHRLDLADTERQLAEERARVSEALRDRDDVLQIALRANGMGLWVSDIKHHTTQWSDEVFRIIGHEPGSLHPSPESLARLIHPDDLPNVTFAAHSAFSEGNEYNQQYRVIWPDGSIHWLESQGRCQFDPDGQINRVVGVMSDITSRKRAEEAMLQAEKLAVAGRLAASVAHEINNPLEAVTNLLYLITTTDTLDDAHTQAAQALDELMRVSQITQQTLKFHRQLGKPRSTLLSDIASNVLALYRGKLAESHIAVELRVKDEVPVVCMTGEVQQIISNLVSNAIEAMPHTGRLVIRIRPSLDWRNQTTPGMRLTFCDTGTGMSSITLTRVFEPFFTTKADTGTGLGMWVVSQLTERHHGHVRVWSRQRPHRSGTATSIFLPLGDSSAAIPHANTLN